MTNCLKLLERFESSVRMVGMAVCKSNQCNVTLHSLISFTTDPIAPSSNDKAT